MEQATMLLISMLFGTVLSQSLDFNNPNDIQSQLSPAYSRTGGRDRNGYWPFQKNQFPTPTETRFNLPPPQTQRYIQDLNLNPTSQDLAIQRRPYQQSDAYPIVLSQDRGAYAEAIRQQPGFDATPYPRYQYDQFQYRPTQVDYNRPTQDDYNRPRQVDYQAQRPLPPAPQRPVITLGPQPKLAYGEPFIRVPYDDNRRQNYPSRNTAFRLTQNQNREFGPFGTRGPYRPPIYTDRQAAAGIPEYGPFGDTGPYAPSYKKYLPALTFRQDMNPGTGEYEVEYQTANGIYRKESGGLKRISVYNPTTRQYEERVGSVKAGIVSWTSPEGIPFSYSFIADERGYRPSPLVQAIAPEALALAAKTTGYRQTVIPYQ